MVTASTRKSVLGTFDWSSPRGDSATPLAVARRYPVSNRLMSAASMASRGHPNGGVRKVGAHVASTLAGTYPGEHGRAHRVVLRPCHGDQPPPTGVRLLRGHVRSLGPSGDRRLRQTGRTAGPKMRSRLPRPSSAVPTPNRSLPPPLEHLGAIDDLAHERPEVVVRLRAPRLHSLSRLLTFLSCRDALVLKGLSGRVERRDESCPAHRRATWG